MGFTEELSKLIVDFSYDKIPERGISQAKAAVIDTLGATILGYKEPIAQKFEKVLRMNGCEKQARILGSGEYTSLNIATAVNSISMHCMDYDNGGSLGHPACVMLAPALAVTEYHKLSGRKLIEAYAVGYELGARMRTSLGNIQFGAGFHATSLLGTICSAAVTGKLLEFDTQTMRMALSIATSLSSGMLQSFGTDSKPVQVARAAESGVLSALLASEGCVGDPDIFEERKGFYYVFGQEGSSMDYVIENFANPLALASERGHFKQWACCGGNYEILTLLYKLREEMTVDISQIEDIHLQTSMDPPGPAFRMNPRTPMEGRFSLVYNTASCLVDGIVDLNTFTEEKFNRPEIHSLISKMHVSRHPDYKGNGRFITIDIKMKDGRIISRRQDASSRYQLEADDTYNKFADNARIAGIADEKISEIISSVHSLDTCADVSRIIDILCD